MNVSDGEEDGSGGGFWKPFVSREGLGKNGGTPQDSWDVASGSLIAAVAVTALATCPFAFGISVVAGQRASLEAAFVYLFGLSPLAGIVVALIGVPVHLALATRGLHRCRHYACSGAVIGFVCALLLDGRVPPVLGYALLGGLCGGVFWLIAVLGDEVRCAS